MIANNIVQADFVTSLKDDTTLTDALVRQDGDGGIENIKESQYIGTQFTYPAVRVRLNRQVPITNRGTCDHARLSFSIRVLTEGASSKDGDVIAGIVNDHFHGDEGGGKFFQGTGWSTYLRSSGLVSADRLTESLWMAEAFFEGIVYPA